MPDDLAGIPVTTLLPAGRYGRAEGPPGLIVRRLERFALALLIARKGCAEAASETAAAAFGCPLLDRPKVSLGPDLAFMGTGPGRWLVSGCRDPEVLTARLSTAFQGRAAVTDQSDGAIVLDVFGPDAKTALQKIVPIDLHPASFAAGDVAATLVSGIALTFWQLNDSPAYRFAVPRSFAPAFLRALVEAGAAFGVEMEAERR